MALRYRVADRHQRSALLDEYCRTTGCHRKAAIRRLRREAQRPVRPPGRPRRYGPELAATLERLWLVSDRLSGKLLAAVLPTLLTALQRHHHLAIAPEIATALRAASPATLDRLLRPLRRRHARQPHRLAPALNSVRRQVEVKTSRDWTDTAPGAVQGDLVLHCGDILEGFFLTTLVVVDVATTWTDLQPIWGLGFKRVGAAVHLVRSRLPFPLHAWHSDNGGEFINTQLVPYCRRHGIRMTRGRPYRKNDQAWVEQRNGLLVRRVVGYDRYSSRAALVVLQRLYRALCLQHNFFRPVRKLVSRERRGSRILKRYDPPRTPAQRVLDADVLTPAARQQVLTHAQTLDPIALAREIDQALHVLWKLADRPRSVFKEAVRG
jgi:hypothetical protein